MPKFIARFFANKADVEPERSISLDAPDEEKAIEFATEQMEVWESRVVVEEVP